MIALSFLPIFLTLSQQFMCSSSCKYEASIVGKITGKIWTTHIGFSLVFHNEDSEWIDIPQLTGQFEITEMEHVYFHCLSTVVIERNNK